MIGIRLNLECIVFTDWLIRVKLGCQGLGNWTEEIKLVEKKNYSTDTVNPS